MPIDYFDDEQADALVSKLLELTNQDRITWSKFHDDEYVFGTVVGDTAFTVSSRDKDDLAPHALRIMQKRGDKVYELQTLSSQELYSQTASNLENIYVAAKRKALNLEDVVKDIFKQLDDLDQD